MSEWIKCSERLPLPYTTVQAYWAKPKIQDVATYAGNDFWHEPENDEDDFMPPTHWMPLPAPPTEE